MPESNRDKQELMRIGAISRISGLSSHTLRKWELRYGAISPRRTEGGARLYSRHDLDRLLLIKRLVDAGCAPREVASLTMPELQRQLKQMVDVSSSVNATVGDVVRIAVVGNTVRALLEREHPQLGLLEIVVSADSAAGLGESDQAAAVDLLVYECPVVRAETRAEVESLCSRVGARRSIIVYQFGTRADLAALRSASFSSLRAPIEAHTLARAAVDLVGRSAAPQDLHDAPEGASVFDRDVPAPRFSLDVVARMVQASPRIRCECPHHLADIVLSLRAFEEYSLRCRSLNSEDAALHHYLWRSAARSRAMFEDAIERVARAEGISLEE